MVNGEMTVSFEKKKKMSQVSPREEKINGKKGF